MADPIDPNPDSAVDPHGIAVIPPVTGAMMDHAARAAAELADGAAHGAVQPAEVSHAEVEPASRGTLDGARAAAEAAGRAAEDVARGVGEALDGVAAGMAEGTQPDAGAAFVQYRAKLLDAFRASVEAAGAHAAALAQARSVTEAMAINADHLRRRLDALTAQSRELSNLAQRAMFEAMAPFKDVLPRS